MNPLLIMKLGSANPDTIARHGDCDQWMINAIGDSPLPIQVVNVESGEPLPDIRACAGAVLTGSGAMVTDRLPWSEAARAWLQRAVPAGVPILGICYGHQLLADAMGGEVDYHPAGLEAGTVTLERHANADHDPLFRALPARFKAQATHYQSVMRLPANATLLAANAHDPHHAYRIGDCAWGVQFHPEFTPGIMQSYIEVRRERLQNQGINPDELLAGVSATPDISPLLARFAQWAWQTSLQRKTG